MTMFKNVGPIYILCVFPTGKVYTFTFDQREKTFGGKEWQNGKNIGRWLCVDTWPKLSIKNQMDIGSYSSSATYKLF